MTVFTMKLDEEYEQMIEDLLTYYNTKVKESLGSISNEVPNVKKVHVFREAIKGLHKSIFGEGS